MDIQCGDGSTASTRATTRGQFEAIAKLIKYRADVAEKTAASAKVAVVQELLKHGAEVDAKDKFGTTALTYAIGSSHATAVVHELLEHREDVNSTDKFGNTPLMKPPSRLEADSAVHDLLLDRGAVIDAKDKDGWTALTRAARGCFAMVATLLRRGATVNARDNDGSRCSHTLRRWVTLTLWTN